MVLGDFLSRQNNDNSTSHEVIPNCYKIDSYLVKKISG